MIKVSLTACIFTVGCVSVTDSSQEIDSVAYPISFEVQRQEHSTWCWAAQSQALQAWVGVNKTQCEIVSKAYKQDCCANPSLCSRGGPIQLVDRLHVELKTEQKLPSEDVRAGLDSGFVYVFYYRSDKGAHVMSVSGYGEAEGCKPNEFLYRNSIFETNAECEPYDEYYDAAAGAELYHTLVISR